jgi:uncharacterized membrane protein YtjA (UPF0391 family)
MGRAVCSTLLAPGPETKEIVMLRLALLMLILAMFAGLFGFTTVAGESLYFARVLFFLFLVMFVLALIFEWPRGWYGPPA